MPDPILTIPIGPFGDAVVRHLERLRPDVARGAAADVGRAGAPSRRITVIAAWRPIAMLCDAADHESRELGRPFVPLIVEGARLSVGPVVRPGVAGCWQPGSRVEISTTA